MTEPTFETKALTPPNPTLGDAFGTFMRTFEEFRANNDARLAEIERRGTADVVTEDKLARLDDALDRQQQMLDRMTLKAARPPRDGAPPADRNGAFAHYMRTGETRLLRGLETKAMSVGSNADGGFVVSPQIEAEIGRRLALISPIRALATVREVSSMTYKKPFMTGAPAHGWVAETAARPQTASPTLDALTYQAMELYAMPAATPALLEDAVVDLDEWLASEVETVFAEQEGTAFVTGDGVSKPKGFLAHDTIANASWEWGKLGHVATGVAGAWPAANPSDILVDLVYALKAGYRQNGVFMMNRKTQAAIRKFRDTTGNYLWQPPAQAGGRASLMTFPVLESEDMPDVGANALSVAFGDFRRGYLIIDRQGVRVLRDPYSAKPYVLFYVTKRVGGGVQDFDAIKLLKFAAS